MRCKLKEEDKKEKVLNNIYYREQDYIISKKRFSNIEKPFYNSLKKKKPKKFERILRLKKPHYEVNQPKPQQR